MATYRIVFWKDVPLLVEVRDEREQVTLPLSERFQQLVDSLAVQAGLDREDAYLAHLRRAEAVERPGGARQVGEAVVAEIEGRFAEFVARAFGRR